MDPALSSWERQLEPCARLKSRFRILQSTSVSASSGVMLRPPTPPELPRVHQAYDRLYPMAKGLFRPSFLGNGPTSLRGHLSRLLLWASSHPRLRAGLAAIPGAPFLVIQAGHINQEIVGFAYVTVRGFRRRRGTLGVFVLPQYQNRGIGRSLLAKTISECRRLGVGVLYLTVRPENRHAIHVFGGLGFAEVGQAATTNPPGGTVRMRLILTSGEQQA